MLNIVQCDDICWKSIWWKACVTVYAWCGVQECCVTNVCDCVLLVWPMAVLCNKCVRWMWHMAVFHDSMWLWTLGVTCGSVAWPELVWLCSHLTWLMAVLCDRYVCDCVYIWHDLWQCCVTVYIWHDLWQCCVTGVTVSAFDMTHGSVVWQVLPCLHLTWHVAVLWDKCVLLCVHLHEE